MKRSSDLLVSNLISAVMSPCGAVVGWCKWAARGGRGWKKSFTISTLPNSHTLQCKDWEIMWQSRHITPPPSPPTHPLTPSHTHTRRSNTHIKSFCNREKCCDSFSDCKAEKKKTVLPVNTQQTSSAWSHDGNSDTVKVNKSPCVWAYHELFPCLVPHHRHSQQQQGLMFQAPMALGQTTSPPSHNAGALAASPRVGRGLHRFRRQVGGFAAAPVLRVRWRFLSSWPRASGAVTNDDFRLEIVWPGLWWSVGQVGVQVRGVAVNTWLFMVYVFTVAGGCEAAGLNNTCSVDGGRSVSP